MSCRILLLLLVALGAHAAVNQQIDLSLLRIQDEKEILGKWSFSSEWSGYMGMAIQFDKGEYRYWFHSDVKSDDEPRYPLTGTWKLIDGVLSMSPPVNGRLYATEWMLIRYQGETGLIAPDNFAIMMIHDRTPTNRWLQRLEREPATWPLMNLPAKPKK